MGSGFVVTELGRRRGRGEEGRGREGREEQGEDSARKLKLVPEEQCGQSCGQSGGQGLRIAQGVLPFKCL